MSDYNDSTRGLAPPLKDGGNFTPQYLTGTTTNEDSNLKPFSKDRIYMITASVAVRVLFGAVPGTGSDISTTEGAILPAGAWFTFRAGPKAKYVYMESADGTTEFRASVWQREI